MAKEKTSYRCTECGWTSPKWCGQCRECHAWGTVEEALPVGSEPSVPTARTPLHPAVPIAQVDAQYAAFLPTGESEVDRVLGGGIVRGAVILLAGEPGVGKSTLLLEVAARCARHSRLHQEGPVLYVTGEESASQVRLRAERIGAFDDALLLSDDNDLPTLLGHIEQVNPSLVIIDSVQTIHAPHTEGTTGGTTQVRAVASAIIRVAKTRNLPVLLVGHVTKDGGIAGPRVLEHLVDVVCQCEGDRHSRLRLLRSVKNRYGPTDEVGCFELTETGMTGLPDPSGLFLSQGSPAVAGSCVTISLEGRRPIPTEIQSLVAASAAASPRRATSGVDHSRVAMILAVLHARLGIDTSTCDVYVSTVGGARLNEPAADLATAVAIASATRNAIPHHRQVIIGEVGLTGEVRPCTGTSQRLQEAARLGFTRAIIPATGTEDIRPIEGMDLFTVSDLKTAINVALT
ncbi:MULTISPECIES: DNA repair protein RadA [unclassified Schaalia]|uniref:DNA repair protein RadA n=1 Tax=unclassified Schaalia TaxID=2691889 RepID=UPI001E4E1903|nr:MULTISPECIES: DNA repair protein RadA [unclassified Schaalia]MCD4549969.1 DNA repair protein RadA [Schaalia sp. lx-260]MCD4557672.1 DNA repair protein RadA [Schaalia sp. lx-100]